MKFLINSKLMYWYRKNVSIWYRYDRFKMMNVEFCIKFNPIKEPPRMFKNNLFDRIEFFYKNQNWRYLCQLMMES